MLDNRDSMSPSQLPANVGASVGSALQFMPSVISSMMQQHIEKAQKEVRTRQNRLNFSTFYL